MSLCLLHAENSNGKSKSKYSRFRTFTFDDRRRQAAWRVQPAAAYAAAAHLGMSWSAFEWLFSFFRSWDSWERDCRNTVHHTTLVYSRSRLGRYATHRLGLRECSVIRAANTKEATRMQRSRGFWELMFLCVTGLYPVYRTYGFDLEFLWFH